MHLTDLKPSSPLEITIKISFNPRVTAALAIPKTKRRRILMAEDGQTNNDRPEKGTPSGRYIFSN